VTVTGDDVQLVAFRTGDQEFAFDILQVERILRWQRPAPVPGAPAFLEGMVHHGESALPVVDLRKRLGLAATINDDTRIVVVTMGGEGVGVVVDEVREVMRVDAGVISAPPQMVRGLAAEFITGIATVGERILLLLNARRLFSSTERVELERVTR
jgi:purine-binding chemotaxis protein CheW